MTGLRERLRETVSVWDRMRGCGKPVALYGMGDGARKILDVCGRREIPVAELFASDEFVRGHSFAGYQVLRYDQVCAKHADFLVVVAFATQLPPVLDRIRRIAGEHETVAPDVPVAAGSELFDPGFLERNWEGLERAYGLLEDEESRRVFAAVLDYKISGKLRYLWESECPAAAARRLLDLGPEEDYVDLGAYRGDTIQRFLEHTGGEYRSILALEPDPKTFAKLEAKAAQLGLEHIRCLNVGAWSEPGERRFAGRTGRSSALSSRGDWMVRVDTVDRILAGRRASYVKLDVEGAEAQALRGCERTIRTWKPKLAVSCYHRSEDLFALPLLLHQMNPGYRFYLRRFPYVPAWDLNLYAI